MPCFLAGAAMAKGIAAINGIPAYKLSHQAGHVRAAAYSCGGINDSPSRFIAFHVSGGTTELLLCEDESITLLGATKDLNAGQLIDEILNNNISHAFTNIAYRTMGQTRPLFCNIKKLKKLR